MTTTLTHYYFFPSPGFEPGYFFKRAGLHALCNSQWQVDGVFGIFSLRVLYQSALQHALVLLTTSLFDYYFLPVPGFEPGYVCQRAGIVSTRPLSLTTGWSFGTFYFWVLTFRYNKGTPITRHRFKSTINKWQGTATYINILPTMSDVNLNLKLKPKPGIWLYTCAWHWP